MKVHILEKATELFTRQGIRSVTMDDVSRHLSISKKTLYQHFTDKDDLVETIVKRRLKSLNKIAWISERRRRMP